MRPTIVIMPVNWKGIESIIKTERNKKKRIHVEIEHEYARNKVFTNEDQNCFIKMRSEVNTPMIRVNS